MNILLYGRPEDKITEKLWNIILEFADKNSAEKYNTILNLAKRLRLDRNDPKIVLLSATSKQELQQIVALKELLSDTRIILILPDGDQDTISMAHKLYPRFLSYIDSNFDDVKEVVSKMVENMNRGENYSDLSSITANNR
jgi:hypothetical protein